MPAFAPVCSLKMLKQMEDVGDLGEYHLLLAHKVLEQPIEWMMFFKKINAFLGRKPFIIMDNSLIELGYPLTAQQIADAAGVVNANVIVLPDVLTNHRETVDLSVAAMEALRGKIPDKMKLLGVVQGTTWKEYLDCAEDLVHYAHVDHLSIPRVTAEVLGSRIYISSAIQEIYPDKHIHMLGFSDNIADDICATICTPNCMGIDSSLPMRLGCEGIRMNTVGTLTHNLTKRPPNWLDDDNEFDYTFEARENVRRFRGIIS